MKDFVWAAVGITSYTVENARKKRGFSCKKSPRIYPADVVRRRRWLDTTKDINNFHGFKNRT
jgi:hypothetical protein